MEFAKKKPVAAAKTGINNETKGHSRKPLLCLAMDHFIRFWRGLQYLHCWRHRSPC